MSNITPESIAEIYRPDVVPSSIAPEVAENVAHWMIAGGIRQDELFLLEHVAFLSKQYLK